MISGLATVYFHRRRQIEKTIIHWPQYVVRVIPGSIQFRPAGWQPGKKQRGLRITQVEFEYERNGVAYLSRKMLPVNWTLRAGEQERVQRELETFAVAFCNPADSAEAYLDIPDRWQRGSISWLTVGLVVSGSVLVITGRFLLASYL